MRGLLDRLAEQVGQERARVNARAAATDLARRRVEREEVELFLADRARRTGSGRRVTRTA